MSIGKNTKQTNLYIDKQDYEDLKRIAHKSGMSYSSFIYSILVEYFKNHPIEKEKTIT